MAKHRLLFVCLGNICRSPMAEGVFRRVAEEQGVLDRFEIDSAGLGDWHAGQAPDTRAQQAAGNRLDRERFRIDGDRRLLVDDSFGGNIGGRRLLGRVFELCAVGH